MTRLNEFDYIFPRHFMVNLENHLLVNILETLNQIIADPESFDFRIESVGGQGGAPNVRMHKFVKGFGTAAYTKNGVYPPKA